MIIKPFGVHILQLGLVSLHSMFSRLSLSIFIGLLPIVFGYAQIRPLASYEILGVKDGLADRKVMDVSSDFNGRYFIHTTSAVQLYEENAVIATIPINNFNILSPTSCSDKYVFRLDENNCIIVINKSTFEVDKIECLDPILSSGASIEGIKSSYHGYQVLSKENGKYAIYELTYEDTTLVTNRVGSPQDVDKIEDYWLATDGSIYVISGSDLYKNGERIHSGKKPKTFVRRHTSQLYENRQTKAIYFSYAYYDNIYSINDAEINKLSDGFIGTWQTDRSGRTLIGVTGDDYLSMETTLLISDDGHVSNWDDILINDKVIQFVSSDFTNDLLACTYNGLYYYDFTPYGVEAKMQKPGVSDGGFGYVVRKFVPESNNVLFAIIEDEGKTYKITNGNPVMDESWSNRFGNGNIWMEHDSIRQLYWMASYLPGRSSRLVAYDVTTGARVKRYRLPYAIEKFDIDDDYLWVMGRRDRNGNFSKIHISTDKIEHLLKEELILKDIRTSLLDEPTYLLGTRRGLICYDVNADTIHSTLLQATEHIHVTNISKWDNLYYIGTSGQGLFLYDDALRLVDHINFGKNASSNTVASVERDSFGYYWVSTFDGIILLNDKYQEIDRIDSQDGLLNSEYNRNASYQTSDGHILFGNLNGYTEVNPSEYYDKRSEKEYLIKSLTYDIRGTRYIADLDQTEIIVEGVPDEIDVELFSPSFLKNGQSPELDIASIQVVPQPDKMEIINNQLHLEGLKRGKYAISAAAKRANQDRISLVSIDVRPDYSTLWNAILLSLLVAGIAAMAAVRYVRMMARRNEEKIQIEKELSSMKMKALRSQLNPHFIFNSLNSIQYYIQTNERKLARGYLNKFAKLMRLILESSYEDRILLSHEIEQLSLYTELEKLRFEDKWNYKIDVDKHINTRTTFIPSMILQPIVENAIIHGLGGLSDKTGELNIQIKGIEEGLKIIIDDNGIGRAKSAEINRRKIKKHRSLSTQITQDRLEILNKERNDDIAIQYIDKYDADGVSLGTTAIIIIHTENE